LVENEKKLMKELLKEPKQRGPSSEKPPHPLFWMTLLHILLNNQSIIDF
jgi:hypothetical protein